MMIDASFAIAVGGFVVSIAAFCIGRISAAKNSGRENGVLLTEVGYIKAGVDELKQKIAQQDKRYIDLAERVKALEEIAKIYHGGALG